MQQWYKCPNCGALVVFGVRFCCNCGTPLSWSSQKQMQPQPIYQQKYQQKWSKQPVFLPNTSGQGKAAIVPPEIKEWNWGAFLLTVIWGVGHRVWISFLFLIPLVHLVMIFVLGAKGNEWAWRSKRWESVEHFRRTQRTWMYAGIVFQVVNIGGLILLKAC